ncbi:MAG: cytochrome C oxidase subunit IV family protein [Bryobacterales bacterium]|nr:cytochrome C oxidase subunit IV family protein [Bryobacterales bacterium]
MTTEVRSVRFYVSVFLALLLLTGLTTGVAEIDLGALNSPVAMLIAAAKAALVALFFMHLRWSGYRIRFAAIAGLLWLSLMFAFVLGDIATRHIPEQPSGWSRLTGGQASPKSASPLN